MASRLKELFARLGPIRGIDCVSYGSPGVVTLRLSVEVTQSKTVSGALALARRGAPLFAAKGAMDRLIVGKSAVLALPTIESVEALVGELAECGIAAAMVEAGMVPDVRAVRDRLGLSEEEFARLYGFDLKAVQEWEAGLWPDVVTQARLREISNDPGAVERIYAPTPR